MIIMARKKYDVINILAQIILYYSVRTKLVYKDIKYSVSFMTL